jgi:predicted DNA-binding transcriptional regulator AlpA
MPYTPPVAPAQRAKKEKRTTANVDLARARSAILVDAIAAAALLGLGLRLFHKLRHRELFPQPIAPGRHATRWRVAYLIAWTEDQATTGKRPEPAELAKARANRAAGGSTSGASGGLATPTARKPRRQPASAPSSGLEPPPTPIEAAA